MDWFAIVSNGVYANPSHTTNIERYGFAVSNGLIGWLSRILRPRGLNRMGFSTRMD